jgi:hypothetical protein
MYLSITNQIANRTAAVVAGVSSDQPSNITSSDFSLNYTSSGSTFQISISGVNAVNYVAISGLNLNGKTITIGNSGTLIASATLVRNNVAMLIFAAVNFSLLTVRISGGGGRATINHIAAGATLKVPNGGEQSGYSRQWLNRTETNKTTVNQQGAPISNLRKKVAGNGILSLPNMLNDFVRGEWQTFLDYASSGQVFYITEQSGIDDNLAEASYACFNPTISAPKASSTTRALQDLSISFKTYNGL